MSQEKVTLHIPVELLTKINDISCNDLQNKPEELILECLKYTANNASSLLKEDGVSAEYEELISNLDFENL